MRVDSRGAGPPAPPPSPSPARRRAPSFTSVLDGRLDPRPAAPAKPAAVAPRPAPPTRPPVRSMLERVVTEETKIDRVLEAAARGKTFSPAELLALQAAVFRYSQTVEVVSRVADRLVGAIKQTMGTQV